MVETGPPLWTDFKQALGERGYTLVNKLTSDDRSSHTQVWLADYDHDGVEEQRVLKISSQMLLGDDVMNVPEKLDDLAQREIRIMEQIDHPHIPAFREFERIPLRLINFDVLATEYVDKPDLQRWVSAGNKLDEGQAKRLLGDMLSALRHVHTELDEPVLHRDIKPSNILYDGNAHAYLFDFNFSHIGQATRAVTVINNYGYYPADAYSGRQTVSQDLCALGNAVIAAAYGKQIAEVRTEQGKDMLDAVDVRPLGFSVKFQKYLTKLTSSNAAYRYQTAAQAFKGLALLNTITEQELDEQLDKIVRGKELVTLLERLRKADELFEYNIPPSLLQSYDDDALLDHLQRVYAQEHFVIEDAAIIEKYIRIGDWVEKVGSYREETNCLDTGAIGYVTGMDEVGRAKVDFIEEKGFFSNSYNIGWKVLLDDLVVIGVKGMGFLPDIAWEHKQATEYKPLKPGFKVRYTGETLRVYNGTKIPDGAEGIVAALHPSKFPLYVAWANQPGLKQSVEFYSNVDKNGNSRTTTYVKPHELFAYRAIRLIKPNHIDFDTLYKECFASST